MNEKAEEIIRETVVNLTNTLAYHPTRPGFSDFVGEIGRAITSVMYAEMDDAYRIWFADGSSATMEGRTAATDGMIRTIQSAISNAAEILPKDGNDICRH